MGEGQGELGEDVAAQGGQIQATFGGEFRVAPSGEVRTGRAFTLLDLSDQVAADVNEAAQSLLLQAALHPVLAQPCTEEMPNRQVRL